VPVFYSMPAFYSTLVCRYKFFLLDINTGTNIIPSYRYYTGILPSSIRDKNLVHTLDQNLPGTYTDSEECLNYVVPVS